MIAVVASMDRELPKSVKRMARGELQGLPPVVVRTMGVGMEAARSSVRKLLDSAPRPDALVCLGFAGALAKGLDAGDLVLARSIRAVGGGTELHVDSDLLEMCMSSLGRHDTARHFLVDSLTVPEIVQGVEEKRRLADSTATSVVTMEDYWVALEARERGVPFLSARAVVDAARHTVPSFLSDIGGKRAPVQVLSILPYLVLRPGHLGPLMGLARRVGKAQRALSAFADICLPEIIERARSCGGGLPGAGLLVEAAATPDGGGWAGDGNV